MSISHDKKSDKWLLFTSLIPGTEFDSRSFQHVMLANTAIKLFAAALFSENFEDTWSFGVWFDLSHNQPF